MSEESDFPAYVEHSSFKPRLLVVFIFVFLLVVAIVVCIYVLRTQDRKLKLVPIPTRTVTAIPTMTPTPTQSGPTPTTTVSPSVSPKVSPSNANGIERSSLKIAVLNGSGAPGAAKGISSRLEGLGYTIQTVGNANSFDYTNITIKIKKSKEKYLSQLKKDLASEGTLDVVTDDTIPEDAEVIVGR